MIIQPQAGPQATFLACTADVAFYGGGAGGGKTVATLLDPLHYAPKVKGFHGAIFRRTCPEITNPGGLWDESSTLYPHTKAVANVGALRWHWPKTKSSIKFSHLQHENSVFGWQGSQLAFIGFDELTHFSRKTFFYMLSRARTACGVNPYVRATMNPDPDSWVRDFIDWYIDVDGLAIPERSGVVRYFARERGDKIVWADSAETLKVLGLRPRSFAFIAASVHDNPILLDNNPDYLANLEALPLVERERLLGGNWNIRAVSGMVFKRHWFKVVTVAPVGTRTIRYWDRAATEKSAMSPDPDWTVGIKAVQDGNIITITDIVRVRASPLEVMETVKTTAIADGEDCEVWLEEDPGQAGKAERSMYVTEMQGRSVRFLRPVGSKYRRALPASAQAEAGRIRIVHGPYLSDFLTEVEKFADWDSVPKGDRPSPLPHDDQVDALSGIMYVLLRGSANVQAT